MNSDPGRGSPPAAEVESPLLAGLIRGELVEWNKQLQGVYDRLEDLRAEGLMPSTLTGVALFEDAARLTRSLAGKMEALASLAETYGGQNSNNRERFFLSTLLGEIISARSDHRWPRFAVEAQGPEVAPIYGNKRWLGTMFAHLLRELELNMGSVQKIVFSVRQLGNHVLLVCRDETVPARDQNRPRPQLPPPTGLTFSFCRRIAELHGGSLRLDAEDDDDKTALSGFTLSLPTSAETVLPARSCDECPVVDQIERYAADLAELIDRCERLEEERKVNGKATDRR